MNNMNNLFQLLNMGMNPMGNNNNNNFQEPTIDQLRSQYGTQNNQLKEMGFFDEEKNLRTLYQTGGNVEAAVERILNGS